MITKEILEDCFGESHQLLFDYLRNKNTGGINNSKGNNFESHFAMFKIVEHFNQGSNHQNTTFSTQEFTFIDDLVIANRQWNHIEYYQIKDVTSLAWGEGLKLLAADFQHQQEVCKLGQETQKLELIVSNAMVKDSLEKMRPANLEMVEIRLFEKGSSIENLWQVNNAVKEALIEMSAFSTPHADKLTALSSVVLAAWISSSQKNVTLESILNSCHAIGPHFIRGFENRLSKPLEGLLTNIPGFTFKVNKGYIHWSYMTTDSGTIPYIIGSAQYQHWENNLVNIKPTDFETLEVHLAS